MLAGWHLLDRTGDVPWPLEFGISPAGIGFDIPGWDRLTFADDSPLWNESKTQ